MIGVYVFFAVAHVELTQIASEAVTVRKLYRPEESADDPPRNFRAKS